MLQSALSRIAYTWKLAREQKQLGFILVLIVVFPLLYTYMLQQFLTTAASQADAAYKNSVFAHQETLAVVLQNNLDSAELSTILTQLATQIETITTAHIVQQIGNEMFVIAASNPEQVGVIITNQHWYQSAIGQPTGLIYPFERNGDRIWRSYRHVTDTESVWYIYTETNLASLDARLARLVLGGYFALFVMMLFLTAIVWWLWRQPDIARQLKASRTQLQEQYNFTNMMVHELRAPLTAMRGYASLIEESHVLPETQQSHLHKISASSSRLARLVNDFLEVARIQAGTLTVKLTAVDIRPAIKNVVDEQKAGAEAKGLTITSIVPTTPVVVPTDPERLQQIVTNLVSNAVKYTVSGAVTVTVTMLDEVVEIRVKDTGHGISAEDQQKLFQPFVRVGQADMSGEIGSGLGMWITKRLIELLHGSVTIESIEGVGTHAIIHLPRKGLKNN